MVDLFRKSSRTDTYHGLGGQTGFPMKNPLMALRPPAVWGRTREAAPPPASFSARRFEDLGEGPRGPQALYVRANLVGVPRGAALPGAGAGVVGGCLGKEREWWSDGRVFGGEKSVTVVSCL